MIARIDDFRTLGKYLRILADSNAILNLRAVLFIKSRQKKELLIETSVVIPSALARWGFKMFKSISAIAITAVATAGLIAGSVALSTSVVPEAKAEAQVMDTLNQPRAKSDRLPVLPRGAACSSRGWPYYEQSCQFDLRKPLDEARTIRFIALR